MIIRIFSRAVYLHKMSLFRLKIRIIFVIKYANDILKKELIVSFCLGQYESNGGKEGTPTSTVGDEKEGNVGAAL